MRETEVLIAGGGPVGLTLAIELGWRGVPCLLAEQKTAFSGNPKAKTVHNRTLELFRRWGLGVPDKLRAAAPLGADFPSHILYVTRLTGELVAALRAALTFESQAELSPERALRIPQSFLEPVLRDEAARLPAVDLRFGWRMESFEQDGDGVRAELVEVDTGRRETVAARWLAGCDGGRSTVRKQLGIRTIGHHSVAESLGGVFRAPELWSAMRFEPAMHYNVLNDDLPAMVTMGPLQPPDVWFFDAAGLPPEVPPETLDAHALLRSVIGCDTPFEVLHAEPWTVHNALAERYREGRVFLLGDAAHMQAPSGGFGMNGGVGDAINFGWKVAAVLQGWGGQRLLDTYDLERRQFHTRALQETEANYAANALLRPGLEDPLLGESRRQALADQIQRTKPQNFKSLGITLGYRYEASPAIVPDGTPPAPFETSEYVPTARPGHRAPHCRLPDGSALYDHLGPGFTLLAFDAGLSLTGFEQAARQRRAPLTVVPLDDPPLRELYGGGLALIRPDHHVAWRGDALPADAGRVWDAVLGRGASE